MRYLVTLVIQVSAGFSQGAEGCGLSDEKLLVVAKAEYVTDCSAPWECHYRVVDAPSLGCVVEVFRNTRDSSSRGESPRPGASQLLIISNDGRPMRRIKGM